MGNQRTEIPYNMGKIQSPSQRRMLEDQSNPPIKDTPTFGEGGLGDPYSQAKITNQSGRNDWKPADPTEVQEIRFKMKKAAIAAALLTFIAIIIWIAWISQRFCISNKVKLHFKPISCKPGISHHICILVSFG